MNKATFGFYKGMDISSLQELLDEGIQVKDLDGTPMRLLLFYENTV